MFLYILRTYSKSLEILCALGQSGPKILVGHSLDTYTLITLEITSVAHWIGICDSKKVTWFEH